MSTRKSVNRILVAAVAAPLALGTVLVAPAAFAAEGSAMPAKSYTAAQVKKHNTAGNCWTIVGRNVYNVTGWIPKHPGGKSVIISMCGKNGTTLFNSRHRSSSSAKAALSRYKIGTVR
jgi:cytochrome b involved in lipid metabolism